MKYIKLDDAIRAAESCTDSMEPISHDIVVKLVVDRLKELPTTEIVRCRECVYHYEVPTEVKSTTMSVCGMRGMMITNRNGCCDMGIPRSAFGTVTRPAGKEGE